MPSEFDAKASLASSMEHCRLAYGGLLRSLMEIYGDSMEAKARLFDELSGNKPSERLIKTRHLLGESRGVIPKKSVAALFVMTNRRYRRLAL